MKVNMKKIVEAEKKLDDVAIQLFDLSIELDKIGEEYGLPEEEIDQMKSALFFALDKVKGVETFFTDMVAFYTFYKSGDD